MRKLPIIACVLFCLFACQPAQEPQQQEVIRPVKLHTVSDGSSEMMRTFPAEVEANQGSFLAFQVNGELAELPIRAGQEVTKGQLLARLDPENFSLAVQDRQARADLANSQLERAKSLVEKGLVSQSEYDQIQANQRVAETALQQAKTDLRHSELRAPFEGTVSRVLVKNFENIQAKQNIMRLENNDLIDVVIQVPERIVAQVKENDDSYQPTVVFDGYSGNAYLLTVKEWDTQADPTTLTYRVVFTMPKPTEFNLRTGMTGNVLVDMSQVLRNSKERLMVPLEAVFSAPENSTSYVWLYDPETQQVAKQEVMVGDIQNNSIAILEGLETNQIIVAAGVNYLTAGQKVRAYQRERGL